MANPSFCPECGARSKPERPSCWSCGVAFAVRAPRRFEDESAAARRLRIVAAAVALGGLLSALIVLAVSGWSVQGQTMGMILLPAVGAAALLIYVSDVFEALFRRRSQ
ncbi:MAG: hypothetical protein HY682_09975 [Chloroflexi bacterium]|nr:hypothetical protein [Chloroflexota bacterium]